MTANITTGRTHLITEASKILRIYTSILLALKDFFSSPAVLQLLLELFSGAVERVGTELNKKKRTVQLQETPCSRNELHVSNS